MTTKNLRQSIESLLNSLSHKQQVSFALYCAKDSFQYLDPKHRKNAQFCIDLVQRWLNGENVSNEELVAAYAAHAGSYAAYSTSSAAASYAAHVASASASYTASRAASSVSSVSSASASASNEEYDIKMKHYYAYLCTEIAKFDKLEMLLLDINY